MPVYRVRHTAKVDFLIDVEARDEEQAMSKESYFAACEDGYSIDHYWYDSEIEREYEDGTEPDISLLDD